MAKKENVGQYQKVADLLKEITSLTNTLNLSEESRVDLEQQILDGKIKTLGAMQKAVDAAVKQEAQSRVQLKAEQDISKEKERQNRLADVSKKLERQMAAQKFDLVGFGQQERDLAKEALQADRKAIALALKHGDIDQDAAFILREKVLEREKEIATMEKFSDKAQGANEEVQAIFDDAQYSVTNLLDSLPGGSMMAKMLGFDKAFETLRTAGTQAVNAVTQSMLAGQGPMAALKAGQSAFNATVMMNPYVAIIAAVILLIALVGKLVGLAHEQTKAALAQAKAQGVSVNRAKEQVVAANEAMTAYGNTLASQEEILSVQNDINTALGASHMINAENAAVIADIGESMGYGAKVAGEAAASLMHLGASAEEAATIQSEANLAAVQAGVDLGAVQKDIAENAGKVSKYFAGNPKALAKAAVEAQKLGMSIDQMAKVSDGLLNIENSLQAQFEFQAFTGKQINMEKARQLALEGDIAGATKEVMGQIGDIHDFEKMTLKQREKLAAMTGMEVGELEKSLALQAKRGDMTDAELAAVSGLGLSMAEIKEMNAEDLKARAQSAQATEAMSMQFKKMKQTVMNALQPLLDVVSILLDVLLPVFKVLGFTIKIAFAPLKFALNIIKLIMEGVKFIVDGIGSLGQGLLGMFGGGGEEEEEGRPVQKMAAGGIAKGGMTLVGENGPELVNMPGGARVTQAGPTGGFLSSLGDMASKAFDYSPMGMAANAVGSIFGGGDSSSNEQVEILKQILSAVQQPPPVVIGDGQVAQISTKISAQKSFKK